MAFSSVPIRPRRPGPLHVLTIGRISTIHQSESNIVAMHEAVEKHLRQIYQGEFVLEKIGERASGMLVNRPSMLRATERIEQGLYDIIIVEDLSRAYRNPAMQHTFVQLCVDHDTRCICLNDNIDTADESWEVNLGCAALRHGLYIPDTRKRVRRTATYAFHKGGMVTKVQFGYRKLTKEEAESGKFGPKGLRIAKDAGATPIIREMRVQGLSGKSDEQVADWLNENGVKPGRYVNRETWNGRLVNDLLRSELLHGERVFRKTASNMVFKTGKSRRARNDPDKYEREFYPELAHLTQEEHAELVSFLDKRACGLRGKHGPDHPLYRRPRSRTFFPRQHARCGICGAFMYTVDQDRMICSRALDDKCWNRVRPRESVIRRVILHAILKEARSHPAFESRLTDVTKRELARIQTENGSQTNDLQHLLKENEGQIVQINKAILASEGELPSLLVTLRQLETRKSELTTEIRRAVQSRQNGLLSVTEEEISSRLPEMLEYLAACSHEFAELMRYLVPKIQILPVQALDTPQVFARVRLKIHRSAEPDKGEANEPMAIDDAIKIELDAFEGPQHVRDALLLQGAGEPEEPLTLVARQLGITKMRLVRAKEYLQLMKNAGITTPYRELAERPRNASRWRNAVKRRSRKNAQETTVPMLAAGG